MDYLSFKNVFFLLKLIENFVILLKVNNDYSNPSSSFIFKSVNKCLDVQINLNLTPKADQYNVHQIMQGAFSLAIGARKVLRESLGVSGKACTQHEQSVYRVKLFFMRFLFQHLHGQ